MGNHKFRLSDMMPSAWFYKLRHISRTRNHSTSHPVKKNLPSPNTTRSQKPHLCQPITQPTRIEKFYHSPINPKAPDTHSPRKSATKRKTIYKPSPRLVTSSVSSCHCSCHTTLNSVWTRPDPTQAQDCFFSSIEISADHEPEFESNNIDASESFNGGLSSWSSSGCCRITSSTTDIIIDMNDQKSYSRKLDGFDTILELDLPPILTKPIKFKDTTNSEACKVVKEYSTYKTRKEDKFKTSPVTRNSAAKLRANFPRKTSKKLLVQACGRSRRRSSVSSSKNSSKSQMRSFDAVRELTDSKSLFQFLFPPSSFLSEGFALTVKKASLDPQREFKESMVEMIVENNIRASKDLEELLACYLSLNSYEFHDFIVKAFVQIWFDMAHLTI